MTKYRNSKPSILGFSLPTKDKDGNTVHVDHTFDPGEVFEANAKDIPELYLKNGWITEAKDEPQKGEEVSPTADAPLNPRWDGPSPTQGSGTSVNQSTTDKDAQKSGTYDRGLEGTKNNPNTDVKGTSGGTNETERKHK